MAQEVEAGARPVIAASTFGDRVAAAVDAKRSQLLVGLDPRPELLPVELRGDIHRSRASAADAVARFCRGLIDAVAPYVVGSEAAARLLRDARRGRPASLRGRLRVRAGRAPARPRGREARRHRLDRARLRRRVPRSSARTGRLRSMPSRSTRIWGRLDRALRCGLPTERERDLLPGEDVELRAAPTSRTRRSRTGGASGSTSPSSSTGWGEDLVGDRGLSSVGAVVGATYPRAIGEARRLMPQAILLLPGVGAQGGTPADVARAFTSGPASALVPGLARGDLRLPRRRRGLAQGGGGRGGSPPGRGLGGVGLVDPDRLRVWIARLAAPLAFFFAATVLVILVQRALESDAGEAGTAGTSTEQVDTAPVTTVTRHDDELGSAARLPEAALRRASPGDTLESDRRASASAARRAARAQSGDRPAHAEPGRSHPDPAPARRLVRPTRSRGGGARAPRARRRARSS